MKIYRFLVLVTILGGCNKNDYDMNEFHRLYGTSAEDTGELVGSVSEMKIYFGHQSVGGNIISGLKQWENETGTSLNIIESRDFQDTGTSAFVHYRVGENGKPKFKIDDFVERVMGIPEEDGSVVFFKLCYVDMDGSTDADELFEYYKERMLYLKEQRPGCRLVLVTAPVTAIQKGIRATAKKILKREPTGVLENIKRNEFNERLRKEFAGVLPVFDLAELETTLPDGSTETYRYRGSEYSSMARIYTDDGGHLNDLGARMVAFNLLAFLSEQTN
ncbi:MAG: hypothetical protein EHM46_03300 [Bacteroidetes bacterium]|nr:MAG: hypothetical protein EHM46_03300 [Bacteroidota bacterium]